MCPGSIGILKNGIPTFGTYVTLNERLLKSSRSSVTTHDTRKPLELLSWILIMGIFNDMSTRSSLCPSR